MGTLTRDAILAADDLKTEKVAVPEWGGEVYVRGMTGAERDAFEQSLFVGEGEGKKYSAENLRAKLLARCLVDDKGARLFKDDEAKLLGGKNAAVLDRLFDVAQKQSAIGKDELDAAVKN